MFSGLNKIFERNFIVGCVLPALAFMIATYCLLYALHALPPWLKIDPKNPLQDSTFFALVTWVVALFPIPLKPAASPEKLDPAGPAREFRPPGQAIFEKSYQGLPPWDIPGPQPALAALEAAGEIRGSVLDAGCGTGENALYLAARGYSVWGIDFVPAAIEKAKKKASDRCLNAQFEVCDALALDRVQATFDTIIDCGLFHVFSDEQRVRYVEGLAAVVRPGGTVHILCFSDREPPGEGPRRVTQAEIRACFTDGWQVREIRETSFETLSYPGAPKFSPGGPKAWRATIDRAVLEEVVAIVVSRD